MRDLKHQIKENDEDLGDEILAQIREEKDPIQKWKHEKTVDEENSESSYDSDDDSFTSFEDNPMS